MRLTLALCGVLLVVLAVSSSLGLLSYLGLPANLLVLRVMPLLVLAVGLDNLFFLVHSYEVCVASFPVSTASFFLHIENGFVPLYNKKLAVETGNEAKVCVLAAAV